MVHWVNSRVGVKYIWSHAVLSTKTLGQAREFLFLICKLCYTSVNYYSQVTLMFISAFVSAQEMCITWSASAGQHLLGVDRTRRTRWHQPSQTPCCPAWRMWHRHHPETHVHFSVMWHRHSRNTSFISVIFDTSSLQNIFYFTSPAVKQTPKHPSLKSHVTPLPNGTHPWFHLNVTPLPLTPMRLKTLPLTTLPPTPLPPTPLALTPPCLLKEETPLSLQSCLKPQPLKQ